jgi:hypothetical protein
MRNQAGNIQRSPGYNPAGGWGVDQSLGQNQPSPVGTRRVDESTPPTLRVHSLPTDAKGHTKFTPELLDVKSSTRELAQPMLRLVE